MSAKDWAKQLVRLILVEIIHYDSLFHSDNTVLIFIGEIILFLYFLGRYGLLDMVIPRKNIE